MIGLGRFGYSVAETLIKKGFEVLAIDIDEAKIEAEKPEDAESLVQAVVSIGENIEASILIVMTLKELGVKEIIAKAVTPTQGKVLQNLGVMRFLAVISDDRSIVLVENRSTSSRLDEDSRT